MWYASIQMRTAHAIYARTFIFFKTTLNTLICIWRKKKSTRTCLPFKEKLALEWNATPCICLSMCACACNAYVCLCVQKKWKCSTDKRQRRYDDIVCWLNVDFAFNIIIHKHMICICSTYTLLSIPLHFFFCSFCFSSLFSLSEQFLFFSYFSLSLFVFLIMYRIKWKRAHMP